MRGEDKANFLSVVDKAIVAAVKAGAWAEIAGQVEELKEAVGGASPSKADMNWRPPTEISAAAAVLAEKKLAWAVAEGYQFAAFFGDVPTSTGLLGDKGRSLDLVQVSEQGLGFYDFRVTASGEDICKGLRQLIVHTVLYRAFLEAPRQFGYNTERSPLLMADPAIQWELVAPKDMINPRRQELRWGDKDAQEMQKLMRGLGVSSFSLSRLQAEGEALRANIAKDNFSPSRARQWFENRVTVLIA